MIMTAMVVTVVNWQLNCHYSSIPCDAPAAVSQTHHVISLPVLLLRLGRLSAPVAAMLLFCFCCYVCHNYDHVFAVANFGMIAMSLLYSMTHLGTIVTKFLTVTSLCFHCHLMATSLPPAHPVDIASSGSNTACCLLSCCCCKQRVFRFCIFASQYEECSHFGALLAGQAVQGSRSWVAT